jgi:mercuric ion transport protein
MPDKRLVATGIIGMVVAALCCFTPLLVALLGVVGLSAIIGKLDYVLLPAMAIFLAVLIYGIAKRRRA